jgi:hypothetical protein
VRAVLFSSAKSQSKIREVLEGTDHEQTHRSIDGDTRFARNAVHRNGSNVQQNRRTSHSRSRDNSLDKEPFEIDIQDQQAEVVAQVDHNSRQQGKNVGQEEVNRRLPSGWVMS